MLRPPCRSLDDPPAAVDHIIRWVDDAEIVLLGEATHGTEEFYAWRARLTRALIEQRGFAAVAIEGDWPDAYRVDQYIRAGGDAAHPAAGEALEGFERFPTWMWRNQVVAELVEALRTHNQVIPDQRRRVGFYGLDLYSLHASMRAVVEYLDAHDPEAARAARASYSCFEQFGAETDTYAWATARLDGETCEEAVTQQLLSLHRRRQEGIARDGAAEEAFFSAEQNARLARNAERYYRTMFRGRVASWNVRDEHMSETLDEIRLHLRRRGQPPKIIVWAHNSHVGDARATEMGEAGEWTLGQLVRQRYGAAARNIGFTTYAGTVIAADDWGEPGQRKRVRPALAGSYEALFHDVGLPAFFLPLNAEGAVARLCAERRLERAIGVVYRPDTERLSHYFQARIADQFDAILHLDETRAINPLDPLQRPPTGEDVPETFPTGI